MYPVNNPKTRIVKRIALFTALAALIIISGCYFLFQVNRFSLVLTVEDDLTQAYGQPYTQAHAQVRLVGSRILTEGVELDIPVTVEGTVDGNRVGIYSVCYRASFLGLEDVALRRVTITDTEFPSLRLEGENAIYAVIGSEPVEPGYSAWDAYDGDLTDQVQVTLEGPVLRYAVSDSSGNTATAERTVIWVESDEPKIDLLEGDMLYIDAGQPFADPGFRANDFSDGDITHLVSTEGAVDGYHAGSYYITYTVTDSQGNTASVVRTVIVRAAKQPEVEIPEDKVIYLTFDDGPGPYTQDLLEVLAKYDVQATFFVINNDYAYLMDDIVDQGHTIAIHSMTHHYRSIYASEEAFFEDMLGMQEIIYRQTGIRTTLLRFPGGSSNMVSRFNEGIMTSLTGAVTDAGFQYYDWNVDSNDAGGATTAEEVLNNVIAGIEGKHYAIVLQHDIKPYSVEAVEQIILWGLENGYTFRRLEPNSPNCHHNLNN